MHRYSSVARNALVLVPNTLLPFDKDIPEHSEDCDKLSEQAQGNGQLPAVVPWVLAEQRSDTASDMPDAGMQPVLVMFAPTQAQKLQMRCFQALVLLLIQLPARLLPQEFFEPQPAFLLFL